MSDEVLQASFYKHPVHLVAKSEEEGRPVYELRDYVRIEIPGRRDLMVEAPANDDHKRRFPIQWAQYVNSVDGRPDGKVEAGTLLREWTLLTSAQVKELEHFRFFTVEQIAEASDFNIQHIGMAAGMSPIALRDKARAFLQMARDGAVVMQQAGELAQERARTKAMEEGMREMQAQMEEMRKSLEGQEPKRGRKPKEDATEEAAGA
jgi:hypothetical protein